MSAVYLYDDARARAFQPFALTRPAGELRAGALLVRERWVRALGAPIAGHLTSPHLSGFEEPDAAPVLETGTIPAGAWVVNARFLPALVRLPVEDALLTAGAIVAVRLREALPVAHFADGDIDLDSLVPAEGVRKELHSGWWANDVWDYVGHLVPMLEHDLPILGAGMSTRLPPGSIHVGSHPLFIEDGAEVEPLGVLRHDGRSDPAARGLARARVHASGRSAVRGTGEQRHGRQGRGVEHRRHVQGAW